jgi:hypothetical protein
MLDLCGTIGTVSFYRIITVSAAYYIYLRAMSIRYLVLTELLIQRIAYRECPYL